jgi:hypothetical protein
MASCKNCEQPIFWALQRLSGSPGEWGSTRWRPCELESLRGDEPMLESERGPYLDFRSYFVGHRCGLRMKGAPERETTHFTTVYSLNNPHATLFVLPNAPIEVVQAAYRALAKLYHPDFGGPPERMIAINQAYEEITGGD